jgi:hypothetical protein
MDDRPIPLFEGLLPVSNAPSPSNSNSNNNSNTTNGAASKRLLCVWLDTSWDLPSDFNQRLGRNASCFHFAQNIPLGLVAPGGSAREEEDAVPPMELIDQTSTDAILYLSVFPKRGLPVILDKDLSSLVQMVTDLNVRGRRVFLRFAPGILISFLGFPISPPFRNPLLMNEHPPLGPCTDFNAAWNAWSQQPLLFKTLWRKLFDLLHAQPLANLTAMVWAPFEGSGYPFSNATFSAIPGNLEFNALDTDKNGLLDDRDGMT